MLLLLEFSLNYRIWKIAFCFLQGRCKHTIQELLKHNLLYIFFCYIFFKNSVFFLKKIFSHSGSSLLLSLVAVREDHSVIVCAGFSCCGPISFAAPQHVKSPWTRAWTCIPCTGRQILNHWTTSKVPALILYQFLAHVLFWESVAWGMHSINTTNFQSFTQNI